MYRWSGTEFFTIEAVFDGTPPSRLIVDTGASSIVLGEWFSHENGFTIGVKKEEGLDAGGNSFQASFATVSKVQVGPVTQSLGPIRVSSLPGDFQKSRIAGLFSPQTFFSNRALFLDFPRSTLSLGANEQVLSGRKVLERQTLVPCSNRDAHKYLFKASMNGVSGLFYFDTGGVRAAITPAFAAKLGRLKTTKISRTGLAGNRIVDRISRIDLKVGSQSGEVAVDIESNVHGCSNADGKIGIDWLKNFGLFFDANRSHVTWVY